MVFDKDHLADLFIEKMTGASDDFNDRLRLLSQERPEEVWASENLISSLEEMNQRLADEAKERKFKDEEVLEYTKKVNRRNFIVSLLTLAVSIAALLYAVTSQEPGNPNAVNNSHGPASYADTAQESGD